MSDVRPELVAERYELVEPIGRGGMAEVWRGHDHKRDVPVAVKILDPMISGLAAGERFAREARAAAQIVHPNVVTVLDVGRDARHRFIVMELLTGRSLAAELEARGGFPVPEVCALLAQAAAGLYAAHQAGVVHRDVKPANLHLTGDGTLKVVDFGLAHLADQTGRLTTVGTIVGTAGYLPPEQIGGSGGEPAGDLYALGCVAYELLCGRPPFTGSAPELVYQHVHRTPAPPSAYRPDVPVELEQLILAMLAKNPAQRPASAEHVRRALTAVASNAAGAGGRQTAPAAPAGVVCPSDARAGDTAVLAAPPSGPPRPPGRSATPARGPALLVPVAAAVAAIVVVTLVVMAMSAGSQNPVAAPVPSTTSEAAGDAQEPKPSATTGSSGEPSPAPTRTSAPATPGRSDTQRDPRAWLIALGRAVDVQESFGGMEPDLADKAREKIRKASEKLAEGKPREAQEKLQELSRDLAEARREGRLGDGPLTELLR